MVWPFSKTYSKNFLGIDVGTKTIKIVELSQKEKRMVLENYGLLEVSALYKDSFKTFEKNALLLSSDNVAKAISAILKEAKIKTKSANFSLPDFATFFTTLELPPMSQKELERAVEFEAKKYIPLQLNEVFLDWQLITLHPPEEKENKVLLSAIPKDIVEQYKITAQKAGLEIRALEAEVFALKRALALEEQKTICIIDIGFQSTTVSLVEKRILKNSFSFDLAGKDFIFALSKNLGIDTNQAEDIKRNRGLKEKVIEPILYSIIDESKKAIEHFEQEEKIIVEKIILSGGEVLTPGLFDFFQQAFTSPRKISVEMGQPFSKIFYPPVLEEIINEIGPTFSVAVGEALKGFEQ